MSMPSTANAAAPMVPIHGMPDPGTDDLQLQDGTMVLYGTDPDLDQKRMQTSEARQDCDPSGHGPAGGALEQSAQLEIMDIDQVHQQMNMQQIQQLQPSEMTVMRTPRGSIFQCARRSGDNTPTTGPRRSQVNSRVWLSQQRTQ